MELTKSQLPAMRLRLISRQGELRDEIRAARVASNPDGGDTFEVTDLKDAADATQRQQTDDAQVARDLAELAEVEAALLRLDAGHYGECVDCGETIPEARLATQPAAPCCAPCQTLREQTRR